MISKTEILIIDDDPNLRKTLSDGQMKEKKRGDKG